MDKSLADQVAKTLVSQASNVGETFRRASEFSSNVADSVNDGVKSAKKSVNAGLKTARRSVKDGRDAVEDFIDDTARSVKRNPIQSVLISAIIGVAIGFLLGRSTNSD